MTGISRHDDQVKHFYNSVLPSFYDSSKTDDATLTDDATFAKQQKERMDMIRLNHQSDKEQSDKNSLNTQALA
jgi:hypothetical protein